MMIGRADTGLGYLLLDNRAAPELPPGVSSPLMEFDTYTCTHCERVVVMNPQRTRERYKCRGCSHLLCDGCAADRLAGGSCRTFAQQVDQWREADARGMFSGLILKE